MPLVPPELAAPCTEPTARTLAAALVVAATVALAAGDARAAEPRARGLQLAREGRCSAAMPDLDAALAADPDDGETGLARGQCLVRLQRYPEAVAALEALRAADSERPGVDLALAIALYHDEKPAAAREALARAEARDPDRAAVQLYRGLLLLDAGQPEAGARALERARALDPGYAEPVSSFYGGIALSDVDRERARESLSRVVAEWPGTTWAEEAQRALDRIEAAGPQWWVEAGIGVEYDSNVVLKGSGVDLPDDISDDADWRGVWTASAGSTLYQDERFTLGLMANYYGTREDEVTEFDTQYPTASVWLDRVLGDDTVARARYEFGFAWVDGDDYLAEHRFEGALFQGFGEAGRTRFDLRYVRDDFRFDTFDVPGGTGTPGAPCPTPTSTCGPPGLNEQSARNRDGWEVATGFLHELPLPALPGLEGPSARAGYEWSWYDARGREYSYQQHAFTLGAATTLPAQIVLDVEASFLYRPYRNPTTFPDRTPTNGTEYALAETNRREREWLVGASLSRALGRYLSLVLAWRYDDNDSSAAVFDYDRHVVGLRLEGRLGP